jgi:sulfite dehydrogenase (cytochrome) subunit B
MRRWKSALLPLASFVVIISVAVRSQQPSATASQPAAKADSNPVHKIVLPDYTPQIPQGPHVETYMNNCLLCHSARYVLMQPRFSEAVWTAEVKKMVGSYGASISEHDQALIVEYLTAVHGVETPAATAPNGK